MNKAHIAAFILLGAGTATIGGEIIEPTDEHSVYVHYDAARAEGAGWSKVSGDSCNATVNVRRKFTGGGGPPDQATNILHTPACSELTDWQLKHADAQGGSVSRTDEDDCTIKVTYGADGDQENWRTDEGRSVAACTLLETISKRARTEP